MTINISFKFILGVLFALLVMTIGILAAFSYRNSNASNATSDMVRHTHEVLDNIEEVSSLYKEIQLESNAFLITGNVAIISSYTEGRVSLLASIAYLKDLTKDDDLQQSKIESLESLLNHLIEFTDSTILIAKNNLYSQKNIVARVSTTTILRDQMRILINEMKSHEKDLLAIRVKDNDESEAAFSRTFFFLLLGIAILLTGTFFTIRYNFNKRIVIQEALKSANERFEKLFYESPAGIVISQVSDGVIIDCNDAYAELVNYKREEIIGQNAVKLGIFKDARQRYETVKKAILHGIDKDIELKILPRDRDEIWVSISIQSIRIQGVNCLMSVLLDTTAHKRAEDDMKKALAAEMELNKLKSNFVTLASHEFRTPLTTILSSAYLLENYSNGENKDKTIKHVSRIKSAVNNLTSILDEFLSLTKIEEGRITPKLERLSIKEYVEGICSNLQSFAKPGQKILYEHSGDGEVVTDPVLFGNIINNMVSNSIKYSPENSNITVSSHINNHVEISVKDSGIGIPEEEQKHLFNRFYRASNVGNVQGTGLGLHIMKHYVNMLNGSIEVSSHPGVGSEFKVIFNHHPEAVEV